MKIVWVPPGYALVKMKLPEEKAAGGVIWVPEVAKSRRREEIGEVLLCGQPKAGLALDLKEGTNVWVHPAYGDKWADATSTRGELRKYSFEEIRGVVDPEAEDYS